MTLLALSLMAQEAFKAQERLNKNGIDIEINDPLSLNPFDEKLVVSSVKKTGRLVIADLGWCSGGIAEIILGRLHNKIRPCLKSDVQIIVLPDTPTPGSWRMEEEFYKGQQDIVMAVKRCL